MNNNCLPQIGFGTWKLKKDENTINIISNAIEIGYKIIDTAYSYGNEETIGEAISKYKNQREQLFITGKLWNTDKDNVINACKRTINNLKCDYLDLYLIHWPASKAVHEDWIDLNNKVWKDMEELCKLGLVKNIGVSNFKVNQLKELMKNAKIKPMVNQIEFHPGCMQKDILDYCKKNNILVQAWSPLGSGKLLKKEEIKKIAEKYDKSAAQICIKWCLQNGVSPIVKSEDYERMKQNLDVYGFEIEKKDMKYLNSLNGLGFSGLDSETITLFG